jgi:hypothetical protein
MKELKSKEAHAVWLPRKEKHYRETFFYRLILGLKGVEGVLRWRGISKKKGRHSEMGRKQSPNFLSPFLFLFLFLLGCYLV